MYALLANISAETFVNLGPISLRSLSTAFTRSLEVVGVLMVSTPTDLSSVPDMVY